MAGNMSEIVSKIQKVVVELGDYFVEREELAKLIILALLSKQHVFILGPPGTAKSALVRAAASHFNARYFEYLLGRFTTPEEVLGPIDISALETGKFVRVTAGHLPDAEIAFLDEVFKSNSAILNTLLAIINERKYHEGGRVIDVPLHTLATASNELPEDEVDLAALYDRLLIRYVVDYIKDDNNFKRMLLNGDVYTPKTKVSMDELKIIQAQITSVDFRPVLDAIIEIRRNMRQEGIIVSDRRISWAMKVVQAHAFFHGRNVVTTDDLRVLQHIFWDTPEQIRIARSVVLDAVDPFAKKIEEYKDIINDYKSKLQSKIDAVEMQEMMTKLKVIENEIKEVKNMALSSGRDTAELDEILDEIQSLKVSMLDKMF